ncbi:hypothetical protein [Ectothiorhodospira shaposhnikovii]|uniref:hypothetical protein n=1 Tax=Ectothiorhodospira shaposhnikovii TaxID=1054 RepID=UPI001EE91E92|nr:hypothetical protein [Ectothiorhodospira shaposhnikovii]MCG5514372.1 hypothetical protein [Ectothiorhodospira shaposhnikovii]
MSFIARFADRINSYSLRERLLMTFLVLIVLVLAWDRVFLHPLEQRRLDKQAEMQQIQTRVEDLMTAIQQLALQPEDQTEAGLEARRDALRTDLGQLEQQLQTLHRGFASPREAIRVLAGLLRDRPGVSVVELANLPPEPLRFERGDEGIPTGIFIHRLRLVVEADFAAVVDFMGLVEDLPDGVFWETLQLEVPQWPINRVSMTLYGLSADENWLGL